MTGIAAAVDQRCRLCGAIHPVAFAFCSRCGSPAQLPTTRDAVAEEARALFGSDLTIQGVVGTGATAIVYLAFDPALKRRVAVKVLPPDLADDLTRVRRFRREAQTVAALQHPNIVTIYGLRANRQIAAIVMEYIDGRSLDAVLAESGRLPDEVAGLILSQVAAGLWHAHERGFVHRDIKPANVLLSRSGRAVVSDFGIARRAGPSRSTEAGTILGTPAYMSPEQCLGESVGAPSDHYSLGVLAFELLAGRPPFVGRTEYLLRAHVQDAPPPLGSIRPDLPGAVVAFVMQALDKDPAARQPGLDDAAKMFRALVPSTDSATTELMRISIARAPVSHASGTGRRRRLAVGAAAALVIAGSIAFYLMVSQT